MVVPCRSGALGSVRASMKNSLPTLALAMKHFSPLRIHSSPLRSARSLSPAFLLVRAGGGDQVTPLPALAEGLGDRAVATRELRHD